MGKDTVLEKETVQEKNDELGFSDDHDDAGEFNEKGKKKFLKKLKGMKKPSKKTVILLIIVLLALIVAVVFTIRKKNAIENTAVEYNTATVEKRSITRTVDGSSTVEANDTYDVTALVTGEILSDHFSEGDTVEKDQLLYTIDSSDAEKQVQTAQNSLTKAQQSYADAVRKKADTIQTNSTSEEKQRNSIIKAVDEVESAIRKLNDLQEDYADLTIVSDYTGTISEVLVKIGDNVNDGTQLAKIYDSSKLKVDIPFNEADAEAISVGDTAAVTIAASGDTISGTVERVASSSSATPAHAIVKYVTIVVDNPGGLTTSDKASAVVNGVACNDLGTFQYYDEGYITSKGSGKIGDIYLEVNDKITAGQTVGYIVSDTIDNDITDAQTNVKNAEMSRDEAYAALEDLILQNDTYSLDSSIQSAALSLDDAQTQLEEAKENLEDYQIKAPIAGTIITKNSKAGDKLENNNSSSNEPMAVIYDMSTLKVQLSIDESDIHDISVGQEVTITADAVEGIFTGTVEKVGVNGTSTNGVTIYPVDIVIEEYGDLLPGMNVDCVITVESAEDVLAVPVESLQRGNIVYVEGEKQDENDRAPEGYYSVDVETGVSDAQYIEIKSGLNEGDTICGSIKASGNEAQGSTESQTQTQMQGGMGGMGGMSGGMGGGMGGGPSGGGMGGGPSGGGMGGGPR